MKKTMIVLMIFVAGFVSAIELDGKTFKHSSPAFDADVTLIFSEEEVKITYPDGSVKECEYTLDGQRLTIACMIEGEYVIMEGESLELHNLTVAHQEDWDDYITDYADNEDYQKYNPFYTEE